MNAKDKAAAAHEQITAILTAVGQPMTMPEIHGHAMFRPLGASTRSLGQWLKFMVRKGMLTKRGRGSRAATYALAALKTAGARKGVEGDSVIITLATDGTFRSVRAPAGVAVALELVA